MAKYSDNTIARAKEILNIPKEKIIIYDIETTGLGVGDSEILKITIIDGNGKELFNELMKPETVKFWKAAQQVNHISNDMVADKKYFKDYAKEIYSIFAAADLIVGYNHIEFDNVFIQYNLLKNNIRIDLNDKRNFDVMFNQNRIDYEHYECDDYFGISYRTLSNTCSCYDIEFTLDTKVECTRQCFYKQLEEFTKEPETDETNE